jgi:Flp pilus assembly protein TadB
VVGVGLYGTGLAVTASGENYGFTFGGLAMVLVIWHLSRMLKNRFSERFPKAAEYIYRSRGTPFFACAIALLVATALLLVIKLEPVAEQVAVIVYYLLVVGVVGELVSLRKRESKDVAEV